MMMKNIQRRFNYWTGALILAVPVLLFNGCSKELPDNIFTFIASPDGPGAIPPNSASGTGLCNVTYDSIKNEITYTISWQDLTAAPAAVYFEKTENGLPAGTVLTVTDIPPKTDGATSGISSVAQEDEAALLNQHVYLVITTPTYSSGEIRGQVMLR